VSPAAAALDAEAPRSAADWPTIAVGAGVYLAFGLLTWFHYALPWWLVLPLGGYVVCLHGSLQHEAVHGFPFRRRWLDTVFVFPSLWLWLPYTHYRHTHTVHHRDERLTCPLDDPESNYVTDAQWQAMGPWHRGLRRALGTLAGRLVIGPLYFTARVWIASARRLAAGDRDQWRHWLLHLPSVAVVLWWAAVVCRIPLAEYVFLYAYPGLSLTLLRSYAEHRAAGPVAQRTAIADAGPFMGLLFLHNNLHALHHAEPRTVWHRRPARLRARRDELLTSNGGYRFAGYGELFRRYMFRAKEPVIHPFPDL
jgi:fatty acid desaturase